MPNGGRRGDTNDILLDLVHNILDKKAFPYTDSIRKLIVELHMGNNPSIQSSLRHILIRESYYHFKAEQLPTLEKRLIKLRDRKRD